MTVRHGASINLAVEGVRSPHPNVIGPAAFHGRKGIRWERRFFVNIFLKFHQNRWIWIAFFLAWSIAWKNHPENPNEKPLHKCAKLAQLANLCKMNICSQKSVSRQPRTSPPKFGEHFAAKIQFSLQTLCTPLDSCENASSVVKMHFSLRRYSFAVRRRGSRGRHSRSSRRHASVAPAARSTSCSSGPRSRSAPSPAWSRDLSHGEGGIKIFVVCISP